MITSDSSENSVDYLLCRIGTMMPHHAPSVKMIESRLSRIPTQHRVTTAVSYGDDDDVSVEVFGNADVSVLSSNHPIIIVLQVLHQSLNLYGPRYSSSVFRLLK
jgi:hypothetical protein